MTLPMRGGIRIIGTTKGLRGLTRSVVCYDVVGLRVSLKHGRLVNYHSQTGKIIPMRMMSMTTQVEQKTVH